MRPGSCRWWGKRKSQGYGRQGSKMAPEDGSAQWCGWVKKAKDWDLSIRSNNQNRWYFAKKLISCVQLFATTWTVAYQAPPSMGFSRQEYWSRLTFSSPVDLPKPGIKPRSPALQADTLPSEPPVKLDDTSIGYIYLERGLGVKVDWSKDYESMSLSHVWLFETPGTVARQAPLSMGFSRL